MPLDELREFAHPGVPLSGFCVPTRTRESSGRLVLSNHWGFRACGIIGASIIVGTIVLVPLVTGMTRDGLFRIEGGRITGPIKHMRFNENPLDVLNRVEAMGRPERTGEYIGMLMPALKIGDFNFTSTTKF